MGKPVFEHRHYVKLAAILTGFRRGNDRAGDAIAEAFARELSKDNPRFDRERFLAAARGEPSNGRDRVS